MQVGTTKDQGLYNKPSAAVHPGALAAGTVPQYNTIHPVVIYVVPTSLRWVKEERKILPKTKRRKTK